MTELGAQTTQTLVTGSGAHAAEPEAPAPVGEESANPALLGVPTFVVGSVALGLYLIGFKPADHALGALLPMLIFCNGLVLVGATAWAVRVGQGPVASIFGIFAAFWISFPVSVLGLAHGWWGIPAADTAAATDAKAVFLLTWFVGIVMLTVASLRLPSVFTLLFLLVDDAAGGGLLRHRRELDRIAFHRRDPGIRVLRCRGVSVPRHLGRRPRRWAATHGPPGHPHPAPVDRARIAVTPMRPHEQHALDAIAAALHAGDPALVRQSGTPLPGAAADHARSSWRVGDRWLRWLVATAISLGGLAVAGLLLGVGVIDHSGFDTALGAATSAAVATASLMLFAWRGRYHIRAYPPRGEI